MVEKFEKIADGLAEYGYAVADGFLQPDEDVAKSAERGENLIVHEDIRPF